MNETLKATLITFGLAYTLAKLTGPMAIAKKIRRFLANTVACKWLKMCDATWISEGVDCPYCWSFWTALPAAALIGSSGSGGGFVGLWLAAFGGSCAITWMGRK